MLLLPEAPNVFDMDGRTERMSWLQQGELGSCTFAVAYTALHVTLD